ncbi:MAG: Bax inhibitor-1/YccA family protein [Actinomycetota bacterium]
MAAPAYAVAYRDEATRADFVVKVYQHLILALVSFVAVEALFLQLGVAEKVYDLIAGSSGAWLLVLGGFMLVSWLATTAAHDLRDTGKQYAGLFALVVAEALIFAPFLYYLFEVRSEESTVWAAAAVTGAGFAGLSAVAYTTRKDLSFLRPLIMWGFVVGLVLIFAAFLFGLDLGVWFSVAMIGLAGASILYQTQTVLKSYPPEAYVGGAVQLFASVMLLFWYVLRLFSQLRN